MCGIAGIYDLSCSSSEQALAGIARAMADSLSHRGPDEGGVWSDAPAGIALSQRRLAIVDVSPAGRQPMISASGRFAMTYNGEVFNAPELQARMPRHPNWRGHSDTEVLLEASELLGPRRAVEAALGMYAYALFDRETRELRLVRDRLGKKPLYWTRVGKVILFGSELRALRAYPGLAPRIDTSALMGFVRRGYYLQPQTVYEGVHQLPPGTILTIAPDGTMREERYWSLEEVVVRSEAQPFKGSASDAVAELDRLLSDAVKRRLVSDVPLGAFLSGGYDSSTIVALMQAHASAPQRTFSIGFEAADYDESTHAAQVARHLGTDHTQLIVTAADARAVVPQLPTMFDEPFADSSQIPTYLVSKLARQHVTVALSGDGGDELFAGYNRYAQGERVRRLLARLPRSMRTNAARVLESVSAERWDRLAALAPEALRARTPGDKLHKLAAVIKEDESEAYLTLTSQWMRPYLIVRGANEKLWPQPFDEALLARLDPVQRMQFLDTVTYLPGDILTKVDRASMAVALEARAPMLDHRVVEFAWSLPLDFKLRNGVPKWVLRQVLYRYVPATLVDRPKAGFAVPVGEWLRGPLRDWAEDLLDARKLNAVGLFDPAPIRARWEEHLDGRRNWQHALWNILMFEAWRREHHP